MEPKAVNNMRPAKRAAKSLSEQIETPRSPFRTLQLIETIAGANGKLTLSQVGRKLDIPKTTALSLLRSMVERNYLIFSDGKYSLGLATFRLTFMVNRTSFVKLVRPVLEELNAKTLETVTIGMLNPSDDEFQYVDVVESQRSVRYVVRPGDKRPLYGVSSGLVLLAWQPQTHIDAYLAKTKLNKFTVVTVKDKESLLARLAQVKECGYAVTHGDYSDEVYGIAVPIFSHSDRVGAALAIGVPKSRALENEALYLEPLLKAADQISSLIRAD